MCVSMRNVSKHTVIMKSKPAWSSFKSRSIRRRFGLKTRLSSFKIHLFIKSMTRHKPVYVRHVKVFRLISRQIRRADTRLFVQQVEGWKSLIIRFRSWYDKKTGQLSLKRRRRGGRSKKRKPQVTKVLNDSLESDKRKKGQKWNENKWWVAAAVRVVWKSENDEKWWWAKYERRNQGRDTSGLEGSGESTASATRRAASEERCEKG